MSQSAYHGASAETMRALEAIARKHRTCLGKLRARGRLPYCVVARLECYHYLRDRGWSLPRIGSLFNRDHTTVLYALNSEMNARKREQASQRYYDGRAA